MPERLKFRVSVYKLMCVVFLFVLIHGILVLCWNGRGWLTFIPSGLSTMSNYWSLGSSTNRTNASFALQSESYFKSGGVGQVISRSGKIGQGIPRRETNFENANEVLSEENALVSDGGKELKEKNSSKKKFLDLQWKRKLKKKIYQKMRLSSDDSGSPNDVIRPTPFVELPLVDVWNVSVLNDYFNDFPECRIEQPPFWNTNVTKFGKKFASGNGSIADVKRSAGIGPFLLIVVTSSPDNFEERQAIRQSWGRPSQVNQSNATASIVVTPIWRTLFLIGRSDAENADTLSILLETEMKNHGDILLGDYVDTYRNLTLKVLHGMLYAATRCRPDYLMKADDDVFVNVPLLVDFLSRYNTQRNNLYVGHVSFRAKVMRNPDNRWHVTSEMYAPDLYPPYALGGGYVISGDLLQPLISTAARLAPFPNEDAYVGTLMNVLRVSPVHSSRFTLYHFRWSECNLLYLMEIHNVKPSQQAALLATALRAKVSCSGQKRIKTWR